MAGQLEDTEHTDESNDPQDGQAHGLVGGLVLRRHRRPRQVQGILFFSDDGSQGDEVWDDGYNVDDIHYISEEVELVRARQESDYQLESEPYDAQGFYQEEWVRDVWDLVFFDLGAVGGGVEHFVVFELRQGLQAEDDDGQQDHEHGDNGNDARGLGALRVFEQEPDFALALVGGQGLLLLLDEALILAARQQKKFKP